MKRNPERPPKKWWDRTVAALSKREGVDDPEAVAGWIWYHAMKPEQKEKILKMENKNPGYSWHEEQEMFYDSLIKKKDLSSDAKTYFEGKRDAHRHSKEISKALKMNPIAIYNDPEPYLIYDLCLEIRAKKSYHENYKGERFSHKFSKDTHAQIFGLSDGSLLIKSKKGKKLWRVE